MRLRSLRLLNFRAFEDAQIDFPQGVVLVGANNAGKTSILDAIARLYGVSEGGASDRRRNAEPEARTELIGHFDELTGPEMQAWQPAVSDGVLTLVWRHVGLREESI